MASQPASKPVGHTRHIRHAGNAAITAKVTALRINFSGTLAASAASNSLEGGKEGFKGLAESVPTGKHWAPGVALAPEDIETLAKVGKHVGWVGSVLEMGTGIYEWQHGAPVGELAAKAAGGWAGATGLGMAGAAGGSFIGGPPGAFFGALALGTYGAFMGDEYGDKLYKWLTE